MKTVFRLTAIAIVAWATTSTVRAADIESYFTKDTDAVVIVNVKQMLETQLMKKHALDYIKAAIKDNKQIQEVMKATGLDPLTDIERVTLGLGVENLKQPSVLAIIQGTYDTKKLDTVLEALIKQDDKKVSREKVGSFSVYKFASPDQPNPMFGVVLDNKHLAFGSSKELITHAITANGGKNKPALHKELVELVQKQDGKSSVYVAAYIKGKLNSLPIGEENVRKAISGVDVVTVEFKADTEVQMLLGLIAQSTDDVKLIEPLINGGVDLLKLQIKVAAAQQPELGPVVELVNSMKTSSKEKVITVTGTIKADSIEKMLKELK